MKLRSLSEQELILIQGGSTTNRPPPFDSSSEPAFNFASLSEEKNPPNKDILNGPQV